MGKDKIPPTVTIGGRECEVIPFYSGRAQIVCIAPAHLDAHQTWHQVRLVPAAGGSPAACDARHNCQIRFDHYRQPNIERVLNSQIDGTDVLGLYANTNSLKNSKNEMVMKLGDVRCQTHVETGEETLVQQYADVWYEAAVHNTRRRDLRDNDKTNFLERRAFCECFLRVRQIA